MLVFVKTDQDTDKSFKKLLNSIKILDGTHHNKISIKIYHYKIIDKQHYIDNQVLAVYTQQEYENIRFEIQKHSSSETFLYYMLQ